MRTDKPYSLLLAVIGWGNVFVLGWLMILQKIQADKTAWVMLVLFFAVAVMASAVNSGRKKQ